MILFIFNCSVIALALIGVMGVLMMTLLFPLLACVTTRIKNTAQLLENKISKAPTIKLHIIIPAHNEEVTIAKTVHSVINAIVELNKSKNDTFEVFITVVLDGCTDNTAEVIAGIPLVKVLHHADALGKWSSIQNACLSMKDADWTILVDVGSFWQSNLLTSVAHYLRDDAIVGIAPSYRNNQANCLEKLSWALERSLKSIENGAGGPISVHGATVLYRTAALCDAFSLLSGKAWLNDDVVIPLAIRSLFPDKKLLYLPKIIIEDLSPTRQGGESTRRLRLVRGNLDWVGESFWHRSLVVKILALRRISRMTWAYWLLGLISPLLLFGFIGILAFVVIVSLLSQNAAFSASLRTFLLLLGKSQVVAWR